MKNSIKICEVCGEKSVSRLFVKNDYEIVKCDNCGLVYVNNSLSVDELKVIYKEDYYKGNNAYSNYIGEKDIRIKKFKKELAEIIKLKPKGKLLEIGSAAGFFLEAAKDYFETTGVELSEHSATYSKNIFNHKVHIGTVFDAKFPQEEFDIVVMFDVIEHLRNPNNTLREINRVLKQNGILILSTGDVESRIAKENLEQWKMMAPPWHLFYFSKSTINKILTNNGFKTIKIRTRGLITKKKFINNKVFNYFGNLFKKGDVMTIYCQKIKDISLV